MKPIKPPLGVMDKPSHQRMRINNLLSAIQRYAEAGLSPKVEWVQELAELVT